MLSPQVGKEDEAKKEEEAFAAENIDQILAGRTEKRQIGSRKGNTFSTATFSSNEVSTHQSDVFTFIIPRPNRGIPTDIDWNISCTETLGVWNRAQLHSPVRGYANLILPLRNQGLVCINLILVCMLDNCALK